jgi:hypothetical protein
MPSELPSTWPLGDALRSADAVLANELGVIEGSIKSPGVHIQWFRIGDWIRTL